MHTINYRFENFVNGSLNVTQVVLREKEETVLKQIFAFLFIRSPIVLLIPLEIRVFLLELGIRMAKTKKRGR